jgi:hypothetical protein
VREWYGALTCDKRKTRAYIEEAFPQFDIESGLTDEDELWKMEARETREHAVTRAKTVLDRIFIEGTDITCELPNLFWGITLNPLTWRY